MGRQLDILCSAAALGALLAASACIRSGFESPPTADDATLLAQDSAPADAPGAWDSAAAVDAGVAGDAATVGDATTEDAGVDSAVVTDAGEDAASEDAAGASEDAAAEEIDGSMWCWGTNDVGELGDGT